jgi:hypothetical protein
VKNFSMRLIAIISSTVVITGGLSSVAVSGVANEIASTSVQTGASEKGFVSLYFSPKYTAKLFKAGVFFYGNNNAQAQMGDSNGLAAVFPLLKGSSVGWRKNKISVGSGNGNINLFNGPAETTAGLDSLVIRQAGDTGTIHARLLGTYSQQGGQFSQSLPVFTLAKVRIKTTATGWNMKAQMSMTHRGADTLNKLLDTRFFQGGQGVGTLITEFTGNPKLVGGMTTCDKNTLRQAVETVVASTKTNTKVISIDGIECANGWAVVFPVIGETKNDPEAYEYTQVFQAEGQFWIPADKDTVCGTVNSDMPMAYPSDAQVPKRIWSSACNTN